MDQMLTLLKRKTKLTYDINCVQKYMEGGDYDQNLEKVWQDYNDELSSINDQIANYVEENGEALYEERKGLKQKVKEHRSEIVKIKEKILYLDQLLKSRKIINR